MFRFSWKILSENVSFKTLEELYSIKQTVNFSFASKNSWSDESLDC